MQQPEYFKVCVDNKKRAQLGILNCNVILTIASNAVFLICPIVPCLIPSLPSAVLLLVFRTSLSFVVSELTKSFQVFSVGSEFFFFFELSAQTFLGTYLKKYKIDSYNESQRDALFLKFILV